MGTHHLFSGKQLVESCIAHTGIQRPMLGTEHPDTPCNEGTAGQYTEFPATAFAILSVDLAASYCGVSRNAASLPFTRWRTTPYLIEYGSWTTPNAVSYQESRNIQRVREIQAEIHEYYAVDASKYDEERKLKIRRIYDLIPSNMENKKKRIIAKQIENKRGKTFGDYQDEFEYLISAGIALNVQAISNPRFPLIESEGKNLLKLYLNDVGILSGILYGNNIRAILDDVRSINLGSVYESVVASELVAHGHKLFYYDNRNKGEVDYLIDDFDSLSAVPIEVKSGRDYTIHSALNTFVSNEEYHVQEAFVLSNEREITHKGKITYLPIYFVMFFQNGPVDERNLRIE